MADEDELGRLRREVTRLEKMNSVLMARVERTLDQGSAFGLFENAISLEKEVRQRTAALRTAMRELSSTNEELRGATLAADAANRAKSEFIARISHELRTPMNGVMGMTELLLGTQLSPVQEHWVQTVSRSAQLLLRVIDDVLDFTKIEQEKLVLEQRGFEFASEVVDTLDLLRGAASAHSLVLLHSIDPALPEFVVGDSVRLRQILTNLVGNAIKFTPRGSVSVRCSQRQRVDERVELQIEVEDTGVGIAEAAQVHIFNAFTQADGSTTRTHGGTGLGLAIVRQLAERMGGNVAVRSRPGEGSTFTVTLWLGVGARPVVPLDRSTGTPTALGLHVLLAEDNPINIEVLAGMLERLGCTYERVGDGLATVEAAARRRFDAILMDWHMPLLDGLGATAKIRDDEQRSGRPRQPIIAVTANALAEDRARCLAVGMDGFLSKPFSLVGLAGVLGRREVSECRPTSSTAAIDVDALVELVDLDETGALLGRVTDLFCRDTQRAIGNLEQAVAADDVPRVADEAHRLRSSCGYIGARAMVALCEELEAGARGDALLEPIVQALATEFERARARLPTARAEATAAQRDRAAAVG